MKYKIKTSFCPWQLLVYSLYICCVALLLASSLPGNVFGEVTLEVVYRKSSEEFKETFFSEGKEIAQIVYDAKRNILKKTGVVPDGVVKSYHVNGNLKTESNYRNGERHGISKEYLDNGNLSKESNYKDGQLNGIFKIYDEDGKLVLESNFKDGEKDGISRGYYEHGNLFMEENYKGGKLNGLTKIYYENGSVQYKDTYKDDEKINRKEYDVEGKLKIDQDYQQ